MKNFIKYLIRRINTDRSSFELMKWKAKHYDDMVSCITVNSSIEYENASNKKGVVLLQFPKSVTNTVSVNLNNMLRAGGYEFSDTTYWDIKTQ